MADTQRFGESKSQALGELALILGATGIYERVVGSVLLLFGLGYGLTLIVLLRTG